MLSVSSRRSRDFPTPAWPITVTRCGRPSLTTRSNSDSSRSDSSSRPTSGVQLPAARAARPRTTALTASQAQTGSAFPLSSSGTSSTYSIAARVRRWVTSPTVTVPGFAAACRRAATLTGSPITV